MFEKIVQRLLNRILGQYVQDFKSDNLKIGLWNGDVLLKDVKIKKETLKKFNLPFKIKYSNLRCLKMNIPWSSLASSKIQVLIEGLQLIITQIHPSLWQLKNQKIIQLRKQQIRAYCQSIINDFALKAQQQNQKKQQDQGYFSNLVIKIIDNLQVTIKDIHIRFQDQITKQYSFGTTLQQLNIFTVDAKDNLVYIDRTKTQFKNQPLRKRLILSNFGIYWNERSNFFEQQKLAQRLKQTIARKTDIQKNGMNYIILMSFEARLLQRQKGLQFKDPQIDFFLDFDQLKIQISNKQLQQIVNLTQRLQKFTTEVKRKNKSRMTKQQLQINVRRFKQILPQFYKNQYHMSSQMKIELQQMLQKIQVQTLKPVIKKYLQEQQKQRIMKQKRDKSRGWFSGPKQITLEQQQQIQKFLDQNFGKQIKQVTRPKQYFYTRINLRLKLLQIVIANSQNNIKQGIRLTLQNIGMQFKLRQSGYWLQFGINDIYVHLFKKLQGFPEQQKVFLRKRIDQYQKSLQYVRLIVQGSPLNRPYADTYIKLITEELLIMFDPKIIKIATDFINVKVNAQNSSAALEKYGEIKQKTTKSVNQSIESSKKSFIYIDIKLKAITSILYLDPKHPKDIWAMTLGQTKIYTDQNTLKDLDQKPNKATQKYSLQLNNISFSYYKNEEIFFKNKMNENNFSQIQSLQNVFKKLNIDITLQIFKESTTQIPKLKLLAQMNQFKANLTSFTYKNLQQIGLCFQDQQGDQFKIQQKFQQKSQVMKNAKKIGFIFIQENSVTKNWKKYIGVLSDNYLYLYNDKKDLNYASYYYVKNSQIKINQNPSPQGKKFIFNLKNKVNAGTFGFQKKDLMDSWIQAIKKCTDQQQQTLIYTSLKFENKNSITSKNQEKKDQKIQKKQINPNLLNFQVVIKIQAIGIKTYLTVQEQISKIVQIYLTKLNCNVLLHEQKIIIQLSLFYMDLRDNIFKYKWKNLNQFLYTERTSQLDKLIDVKIVQINQKHPQYNYIDNEIYVSIGRLICNYKAQTVVAVMNFFIPPSNQQIKKQQEETKKDQISQETGSKTGLIINLFNKKIQKFSLKVHLKMSQFSIKLINTKTLIYFAQLSIQNFQMMFAISEIRMVLTGGLQQLSLKDFSNYGNTIIQQQQSYQKFKYILTSQRRKNKNIINENENENPHLIFFDINMLNKVNQTGKKMIIITQINDLQVSYIQQPVLRLITYLNTQFLPSLTPQSSQKFQNKKNQQDILKTKIKKQQQLKKKDQLNSSKPQVNTMDLLVTISNINVIIQPRNQLNQQLKLNIQQIVVKNSSIQRPYIKKQQHLVLVQNYAITLNDMSIFVSYIHPKNMNRMTYKLTPDIDLKLSVDLIQNPMYFQKTYGKQFLDGMRIQIEMSDFFMRINHQDYNFLMKCLYWNITYDDNAQQYLFDIPEQTQLEKTRQIPPLYFKLNIESISLFIIQENLPLAFILLNQLSFQFMKTGNGSTKIDLNIVDLLGSSLIHKDNGLSIQKGMFNSFAYQKKFNTEELKDLDKLLEKFQRKDQLKQKSNKKAVITFLMQTDQENNSFMGIKVMQLKIAVQMRTLLIISQLAVLQQYIKPPPPILQKKQSIKQNTKNLKKEQIQKNIKQQKLNDNQKSNGKTQIYLQLQDFIASLTDTQKQNFFIMEGQVACKILNFPAVEQKKIIELSRKTKTERFLQNSNHTYQVKNFSIYFCNIQDMSNKRYILKPFSILVKLQKYYEAILPNESIKHINQLNQSKDYIDKNKISEKQKKTIRKIGNPNNEVIILLTQIDGFVDNLVFETSIKDILKINQIAQQNLENLRKYNQNVKEKVQTKVSQKKQQLKEKIQQKKQQLNKQKVEEQKMLVQRTKTQINSQKVILEKMKAKIRLQPISFLVINDCNQNFMPVIRFILQQSIPTFQSDILKAHLSLRILFNLSFFNSRSSKWEPVIQNYGATIDYLNLIGQKRNVTKIILANLQVQELKQLKINISTQFIASLMQTIQISKQEQKNIKSNKKIEKRQQIQVSPFIFENITNKNIAIKRNFLNKQNQLVLKPMFKGTVRLTDNQQSLYFSISQKKYKISLQHYGTIKIADSDYYIEFKVQKINRMIRFLSSTILENKLSQKLYVKRYYYKEQDDIQLQKNDMIALDGVKSIQISLNKRSYTEKADISIIKQSNQTKSLISLNKKFILWLTKKTLSNQFTTIQVWPPLILYNCLPKQFIIQFIIGDQFQTKTIKGQTAHEITANISFSILKFKVKLPGFFWSPDFQIRQNIIGQQKTLQLRDRSNGTTTINYIVDRSKKGYNLIIYCKSFLVSELQDDILAYGNLLYDQQNNKMEKYHVLGGQREKSKQNNDNIVIIGSQYGSKLRICGQKCPIDFSQPFSLGGIGMTQNRRIVIKRLYNNKNIDLFTTIGVDVSIKQMFKNLQIFTKKITIHSRAIIVNQSDKKFKMREQGSAKQIFFVQKGQRKNLFFTLPQNPRRPRGMIFSTENSFQSLPVNISQLGTIYFKIMNKQTQCQEYYKIYIHEVSKYIFYEISQLSQDSIPYQIQNRMPHTQVLLKFNNVILNQGDKFSFINQNFSQQHKIKIRITHENSTQQKDITIKPDDLNFKHKQSFNVQIGGMKGTIHVSIKIKFDDKKKYIIIDQVSHRQYKQLNYDQQQQYEVSSMHLRLQKIVFSFIQNHISIQRPYESFSFFLTDLQCINQLTNIQSSYQIKLRYLQFDQQEPFNMPNPVIITPYRMKQFLRQQKPKSIFNALVKIDKTLKQNTLINKIQIQFNDLVVKISQYFIDVVMQMTKQFYQVYNYKQQDYIVKREVDKWNEVQIPKQGKKTFIKYIAIAPFVLQVSAEIKLDKLDTQSFLFFGTILNALGVVITNIQGAPITLQGKQLKDCVDTLAGINQKLINHYKNSVIKQFYKVFGSLNIIGNPVGFFRNISTGIRDLKQKPSQGFVQGPLQFGKGIAQGTSSLIAHSIGGALNSVSKVTGTISSGLAVLAFDKEFQELREKQKVQKPQHIFEGLQKGGKAVFYGFRQGIKGVFLQPYQNTKKQGVFGFFKGSAKGLAGLVVKPITGVIDFASKTTEGLKNTALFLQDKPNQNRMRYPRVFYTECFTVKEYDYIDSKLNAITKKIKYQDQFEETFYIQNYLCDDGRYLLVLQDKIMMINIQEQKISWTLNMKTLKIKNDQQRKQLNVTDGIQYTFRKNQYNVKISDNSQRLKIINQIDIIQKQYL